MFGMDKLCFEIESFLKEKKALKNRLDELLSLKDTLTFDEFDECLTIAVRLEDPDLYFKIKDMCPNYANAEEEMMTIIENNIALKNKNEFTKEIDKLKERLDELLEDGFIEEDEK